MKFDRKPAPTPDELRRLYVDQKLTLAQIGAIWNMGPSSVLMRLRDAGIETRKRRTPVTREVVETLVAAGKTPPEMARIIGTSPARVYQVLREHGLKARDGRAQPKPWRRQARVRFSGYWMLYRPDHPYADKRGRVMEHRLVMEEQIGRYLRPEEVVHHMNHVRDDNRPENLMLLPDAGAHSRLHNEDRRKK